MKKSLLAALAALLLSACGQTQEAPARMTQEIAQESLTSGNAFAESESAAGESGAAEQTAPGQYYLVKAGRDAVELDLDALEADYRIGKLSEDDFRTEKEALEREKHALKAEKERLEPLAEHLPAETPAGTAEELLALKRQNDLAEEALEADEDRLEADYLSGAIGREEYIAAQAELLRRDDELDAQEEALENALEAMGWDD